MSEAPIWKNLANYRATLAGLFLHNDGCPFNDSKLTVDERLRCMKHARGSGRKNFDAVYRALVIRLLKRKGGAK